MALHHNPRIVTSGLELLLDAQDTNSYPGSGTTWYDLSGNNRNATLTNGATYSNGYISFDGTDDRIVLSSNVTTPILGWTVYMILDPVSPQSSTGWNYWFLKTANAGHKYEFGSYGTNGDTFAFKDNIAGGTYVARSFTEPSLLTFGVTTSGFSFISLNGASKGVDDTVGWTGGDDISFGTMFNTYATNCRALAIYSRELSNEEVLQNYNSLKGRLY